MEQHQQIPTTIKEVGIHIGYLREDMSELKSLLREHIEIAALKGDVEREVSRLDARIDMNVKAIKAIKDSQQKKNDSENTIYRRVTYIVIAGIVVMVLAWYGIDQFFRL